MFLYRAYSLTVACELELPGIPGGTGAPDVVIRLGTVPEGSSLCTSDTDYFRMTDPPARFLIRQGREILIEPVGVTREKLSQTFPLTRVFAPLLRQRGFLSLHASAVMHLGAAVLFMGPSRRGKSTTAAAFHRRGCTVVTDDLSAIRMSGHECRVLTAWPHLRLRKDARKLLGAEHVVAERVTAKHHLRLAGAEMPESLPASRIYILEFGERCLIEAVDPVKALPLISAGAFLSACEDQDILRAHFSLCADLVTSVPVRRLVRPRGHHTLDEVVDAVLADSVAVR